MKQVLMIACAAMALSACASDGYGYGGGGDRYSAYYDGGYGTYNNGYWGRDGVYYYRTAPNGRYLRDDGRHFRRDQADGYHGVRGHRDGYFRRR